MPALVRTAHGAVAVIMLAALTVAAGAQQTTPPAAPAQTYGRGTGKTTSQCDAEYMANKAAIRAAGQTQLGDRDRHQRHAQHGEHKSDRQRQAAERAGHRGGASIVTRRAVAYRGLARRRSNLSCDAG